MVVDAMLARVLAMTLCPAVSASVTSRSSIETAEQIDMGGASFLRLGGSVGAEARA